MKKTRPIGERIIFVVLAACLLGGTLFFMRQTKNLRVELAQEKRVNRDLTTQLETARASGIPREEIVELKRKGLSQPMAQLLEDLEKHPPRIPQRGVLGGTMGFHDADDIRFLGDGWVFAGFDDGHILGKALLRYEVKDGGKISWKLVGSVLE